MMKQGNQLSWSRGMLEYPMSERKLVYRVLHKQLTESPELMDSSFLEDLQRGLQSAARAEGVDIADHGAWDAWLGNSATSCEVRMANRRVIG
jgi:hypothetical protein